MIDKLIKKRNNYIYKKTINYLNQNKENTKDKEKLLKKIININNTKKRYDYIYEALCRYLDKEFKEKNPCDFRCNICKKSRYLKENNIKRNSYLNGCCYSYTEKSNCKYFKSNGTCSTKCLGCKLFICDYLKKEGYNYKLNNIYLSKYLFNYRQKKYIEYAVKKPKEEIIKGILKRRSIITKLLDIFSSN